MTKAPKKHVAKVAKPIPTQAKVDDIREEASSTVAEPQPKVEKKPAKAHAPAASPEDPYPTQADLDAMKAGTYSNREMKSV